MTHTETPLRVGVPSYRKAVPTDNDGLLDLARACPVGVSPSLHVDRSPRYTRFFELLDPAYRLVVAEHSDRLVGSIAGVSANMVADRRFCRALCIRDLKVLQPYRGRTVAYRLVRHLLTGAESEFDIGLAFFSTRNARARRLAESRVLPSGVVLRAVTLTNVLVGPWTGSRHGIGGLRPLVPADAEAASRIMESRSAAFALSPAWTASAFRSLAVRFPGLLLGDCVGVEKGGRLVAVLCSWNPIELATYRLMEEGSRLRVAKAVLRLLAPDAAKQLPLLGDALKLRMVICAGCSRGFEWALAGLFADLASRCRSEGLTHFTIALSDGDYRTHCLAWQPRVSLRYAPYIFSNPAQRNPMRISGDSALDVPPELFL